MKFTELSIPDLFLLEPRRFGDERGWFMESYNQREFEVAVGRCPIFLQDNHSLSAQGVLRGLHYQIRQTQAKLVRVVSGTLFDVVVDLRRHSPAFGRWEGIELSAENGFQLWVPEGFAHGFVARTAVAEIVYKSTGYYAPEHERCIRWNDSELAIGWGIEAPIVSSKDANGVTFRDAEVFDQAI